MSTTMFSQTVMKRRNRAQCALGYQLQTAREAAGLTREQLDWREDHAGPYGWNEWCAMYAHRVNGGCTPDDHDAFFVRRLERMSQGHFDRASRSPKRWLHLMAMIDLGNADATEDELRDAWNAGIVEVTR